MRKIADFYKTAWVQEKIECENYDLAPDAANVMLNICFSIFQRKDWEGPRCQLDKPYDLSESFHWHSAEERLKLPNQFFGFWNDFLKGYSKQYPVLTWKPELDRYTMEMEGEKL